MVRILYLMGVACMVAGFTAAFQPPPPQQDSPAVVDQDRDRPVDDHAEQTAKRAKSCFKCHSAPFRDLATDRAWIDAIPETT